MTLQNDLLLRALNGEMTERPPVWVMRQAGRILPVLTNYFGRVLAFHHLPNHDPSAVASALRVHPYAAKEYARAARNYPARKVSRIFGYLRECDAKSKGIGNATVHPFDLLEEALFKTLH